MRTRLRSKVTLLFMTLGLLLAIPAVALADNIQDNITDNVASSLQLTAGDANSDKTAEIRIIGNNSMQDPDNGCNFDTATESLTLSFTTPTGVTATALDGATATPGQMKFTVCGVDQTVKFSASSSAVAGNYTVTANIVNNTTDGTFFNQVSIPITVNAPADTTPPEISYVLDPASPDGNNGWYKSDVTLTWNVSEPQSPNSLDKTGCVDQNITADQAATVYSCSATSAGGSADEVSVTIKRDGTAPGITLGGVSGTAGTNGWYTSAVSQTFNASDATSGVVGPASIPVSSDAAEGDDVMIASGAVSDNAGNSNPGINAGPFKVDLSNPTNVAFVGGPAAGGSYDFGNVPAAPTCTAEDAVSGLKDCAVTGYSNAVGNHELTATATDNAGRTAKATRTYAVKAYRLSGFYQPVDMNDTVNTVKNGSTVPVKFELFQSISGTELQSTSAISSILAKQVNCAAFNGDPIDEIETLATGGTSLRYDATAGQFIYNWQTPKGASQVGKCFSLTMSSADNSSTLVAYFKLK
jgi:hypothetical protein